MEIILIFCRFIRSRGYILEVKSSCQWRQEKNSNGSSTPSLFQYHNKELTIEEIQTEIIEDRFFGLCKIDIEIPISKRAKWQALNFPPIIAKRSLSEDEISEEMKNLLRQKKTKFPLGRIQITSLHYTCIKNLN